MASQYAVTSGSIGLSPSTGSSTITRVRGAVTSGPYGYIPGYGYGYPPGSSIALSGPPKMSAIRGLTTAPTSYTYVPGVGYVLLKGASIGLTGPASVGAVRGITSKSQYYSYVTYSYMYNGGASIGLNPSGTSALNITRAGVAQGSIGLNSLALTPAMNRAAGAAGSIGLSGTALTAGVERSVQAPASIGLTGPARISKTRVPIVRASIGLTSKAVLRVPYLRGSASGHLGLSFVGNISMERAVVASGSIGLSGTVNFTILPAPAPGAVALVEIQDGAAPSTYGSIQAREYESLDLDQTITSYPKPFTLLN